MRARFVHTESFRLAAIFAALFTAAMLVVTALVYFSIDAAFRNDLQESVADDLGAIRSGYETEGPQEATEVVHQRMNGGEGSFLLEQNGQRLAGNLPLMAPRDDILRLKSGPGIPHTILGRGMTLAPGLYAFAGRDLSEITRKERQIIDDLASIFVVTTVLAGVGGVVLSRMFLARMDAITRTCRAIIEGRFDDRVPVRGTRDELDRLASVINEMLDRIGALMENLRQVSSDIAHDLRTPLTRLRHRLERAGQDAQSPGDYKAALNGALAETDTILALFSALLRIAQIESGSRRAGFSPIDLKDLVRRVTDLYGPVAEDAGHPFQADVQNDARIKGDQELLIQMLANLIENAIRHTPRSTPIALTLDITPEGPRIRVADKGQGVPGEQRAKLFRRFFRLEESRTTSGYGLGLALVSAIADLHGARISLNDNHPGLICEIQFANNPE